MLDHLLDDYFDDRQTEDYDIDHNRLRHNLVEIFGFNEIPKENIRQHKSEGNYPEFFEQLESYGELWLFLQLNASRTADVFECLVIRWNSTTEIQISLELGKISSEILVLFFNFPAKPSTFSDHLKRNTST